MIYISWTQGAFAAVLLLVWIWLLFHPVLLSKHQMAGQDESIRVEWDPKARRRLMVVLIVGAITNTICAILSFLINGAASYFLFFGGILIFLILIFLISYYAEKDNIQRIQN